MITANRNEKIILNLQLIKSDGLSVEEDAIVTVQIFDSTATVSMVDLQSVEYNSNVQSYIFSLDPKVLWTNQSVGTYLVVWSVSNTVDDFNNKYTEELRIDIDNNDIQKILGLVHQNMVIDETVFDAWHNLESARVRLFTDSSKTEVLATYRITANTDNPGSFISWEQIEE